RRSVFLIRHPQHGCLVARTGGCALAQTERRTEHGRLRQLRRADLKRFSTLGAPHLQPLRGDTTLVNLIGGAATRALGFKHGRLCRVPRSEPVVTSPFNAMRFCLVASLKRTFVLGGASHETPRTRYYGRAPGPRSRLPR